MRLARICAGVCSLAAVSFAGVATAAGGRQGGAMKPVLSSGDFNGDTIVDAKDIRELESRIAGRDNAAFFDRNGDGKVDERDLRVLTREVGMRSTALDQELAAVFRATERYRDQKNAIADGFIAFTQLNKGHGIHWGKPSPTSYAFKLTEPPGLNYSPDGKLLAVYYSVIAQGDEGPPAGFTGDESWHSHRDACFHGVNPSHPSHDFRTLRFEECVPKAECTDGPWYRKFYMLHAWLYEPNPDGVFALENPRITEGQAPTETAVRCPEGGGHTGGHTEPGHEHGHTHDR